MPTARPATITLDAAVGRPWDVLVVGAGPAGAAAARTSARHGASVLLVDRARFPRAKVCGCCLSGLALGELAAMAVDPCAAGGRRVRRLVIAAGGRRATVALPGTVAISRTVLDATLVAGAIAAGAHFLPATSAEIESGDGAGRTVRLRQPGREAPAHADVVVAAGGLAARGLAPEPALRGRPARRSRIGVGALVDGGAGERDAIEMACGRGGYVGAVHLEDGRLDVAAAVDPAFVRAAGGAAAAVGALRREAGLPPIAGLEDVAWHGTPALSRRPATVAAARLLLVGDAAGYVEPFTGEGIGWALAGGRAAGALAAEPWATDSAQTWRIRHHALVRRRQRRCRCLARLLRSPRLTAGVIAVVGVAPVVARSLLSEGVRGRRAPRAVDTSRPPA